jgi:hypothetical protein
MTFVSLADACRGLSIDAKTLRRWLEEAQLPLQSHPRDGRKKGLSGEHLDLLARLHHRRLVSPCEPPPPALPQASPPLPTALLAVPEMLCALQAQIAALQQQVAELTQRLQPQAPLLVPSPTEAQLTTPAKRTAKPAPALARSRPADSAAAKTSPKLVHVIPRVEYGPEGP